MMNANLVLLTINFKLLSMKMIFPIEYEVVNHFLF